MSSVLVLCLSCLMTIAFAGEPGEEQAGRVLETEGHPREALAHYVRALDASSSYEADFRLREKIIKLVQRLRAPPLVPEEARKALGRATSAQDQATDGDGFVEAIKEYFVALRLAPWLAEAYYNIAVLYELEGYAEAAVRNYRLYLVASPSAGDAGVVRQKMRILARAVQVSKAGPLQRYGDEWSVSFGQSKLEPGTFRWWQDSTYDLEYSGIEWNPGAVLGLGVFIPFLSKPYGNSFVWGADIQLAYESNTSSACTVVRTDELTRRTASARLAQDAFRMRRIAFDMPWKFGYRFVLGPVAIEPSLGFSFMHFEQTFLTGSEMSNKSLSVTKWGLGWPTLGGKIHVGSFFLQLQSSSCCEPLLSLNSFSGSDYYIDYAASIMGSFSPGKKSSLSISVGRSW